MRASRALAGALLVSAATVVGACGTESSPSSVSASSDQAAIEARIARERKEAATEALRDREVKELRADVKRLKAKRAKDAVVTTVTAPAPSGSTVIPATSGAAGSWSPTVSAWTVVLASEETADRAASVAARAARSGIPAVGVLYSSDFPSLRPGWHVAYAGQFSSKAEAVSQAAQARAAGFGDAYQRYVSAR